MDEIQRTLADLSAVAAAVITILSLFALVGKGVAYALTIPGRIRLYSYKPRFILLPTPEEIAKYCAKTDNAFFLTEEEWHEELNGFYLRKFQASDRKAKERIAILYYSIYGVSAFFIVRMLSLAWRDIAPGGNSLAWLLGSLASIAFTFVLPALKSNSPSPARSRTRHEYSGWHWIWHS